MLIGRKEEQSRLNEAYDSEYSEFVAVYGRRRVGKTFLIRETFNYSFTFQHSGIAKKNTKQQLKYFKDSLLQCGFGSAHLPSDWNDAFMQLSALIKQSDEKKKIVFIDEISWMDAPRSGFVTALEYFWNAFASARKDVLLIICGSSTSWIINKVFKNHGGLHNRVTQRIKLQPFTLFECEKYANYKGLNATKYDLLEYYMVFGGVAFYWSLLNKKYSVAQNIDEMLFSRNGQLHNEFNELYDSLFSNPEPYVQIINALGENKSGMSRNELLAISQISNNGNASRILEDLEECGFIKKLCTFGKIKNGAVYQLIDNFTLFYFKFMRQNKNNDERFWTNSYNTSVRHAWVGYAFERVCFQHVNQIKNALGIGGVVTNVYSWFSKTCDENACGAQIDMIIDRADNTTNICEMKFSDNDFEIDKDYDSILRNKMQVFRNETKTRHSLRLTMITVYGVAHTKYWNTIQNDLTAEDLFKE